MPTCVPFFNQLGKVDVCLIMGIFYGIVLLMTWDTVECVPFDGSAGGHAGLQHVESEHSEYLKTVRGLIWDPMLFNRHVQSTRTESNQTPSLDEFARSIIVESSGMTETGEITLTVSFLRTHTFAWMIGREMTMTQGQWELQGNNIKTSITFKDFRNVQLAISIGTAYVVINPGPSVSNESQSRLNAFEHLVETPEQVHANENGTVSFNVRFVTTGTSKFNSKAFCFYKRISTRQSNPDVDDSFILFDDRYGNVTITFELDASSTADVALFGIGFRNKLVDEERALFKTYVMKYIEIIRDGVNMNESVVFVPYSPSSMYYSDNTPYKCVVCRAYGYPPPIITLSKDNETVHPTSLYRGQFEVSAYVPLDGHRVDDIKGTYTCKAKSGTASIEKQIVVAKLVEAHFIQAELIQNTTDTIEVICTAAGAPRPILTMYLNTRPGYFWPVLNDSRQNLEIIRSKTIVDNSTVTISVKITELQGNVYNVPSISCELGRTYNQEVPIRVIEVNNNYMAPVDPYFLNHDWPL